MTAVVTGGSRGIGLAIAEELLRNNYTVIVTARTESEQLKTLKKEYGEKLVFIPCDNSDIEQISALVEKVGERFDKIDLLVNNAGVAPKVRNDILEVDAESFDYVMNINLRGTFFMTQKFVPLLKNSEAARIVNISSMSAYTASVNRGEYCISKSGISMTTKLFAVRLAEFGISVIEIRPGIIETDMTSGVKAKYEQLIDDGLTPIKRMGKPSDVAKCVSAVADGKLDFCTGSVIDCDGGFSVRSL